MNVATTRHIDAVPPEMHEPLRGELFSIEHLRGHAVHLAKSLEVVPQRISDRRFFRRFQQHARYLRTSYRNISRAIALGEPLTPDAEWLLDNFYVVEEHLREIQEDLPPAYFRELPKLADGTPRVLHLAEELIVHTDSVVLQDELTAFVNEFQGVAPLSIGELWALPIMLRLALVDNLRRLAAQTVTNLAERAAIKQELSGWQPGDPLPESLRTEAPRPELIAQTYTVSAEMFPGESGRTMALEQLLTERFPNITDLVRREHRRQAANQVSIGNLITSMRLISALDWTVFFEETSLAERMLRTDPAGIYPLMDADTRDRYRHAVEELCKRSPHSELTVADRVVAKATQARQRGETAPVESHVGYWLIDDGRRELERELGYRPKLGRTARRAALAQPEITYFGSLLLLVPGGLWLVSELAMSGDLPWPAMVILLIAAAFPISELALSLVNLMVTLSLPPRVLPKLELLDGIPRRWRTFVVVPSLITSRKDVAALLDRLELHYVSNPEPELRFALLTDFSDAVTEQVETDSELLEQAVAGIRRLNATYGVAGRQPFYLFHRARCWNESEQVWMGWERKRGKLTEFNRLLHGAAGTTYVVQEGDPSVLATSSDKPAVPFVITLDADTQLPLGVARRMVGTLAHPLNRARFSSEDPGVARGYSILQPRVTVQLKDGNKSPFSRLFANARGLDPYATAASDVYQDLFGEGSFTGKGIYDVAAFERALEQAFGENQILSHDLIEGCHARVGLTSDIEVIDSFPSSYEAEARRAHRWVRGDWQIFPWLFRRVPCQSGFRPNRLSLLSRWKIFDNLRRSLVPPATCLMLIAAWFLAPMSAAIWSLVAWLMVGWPVLNVAFWAIAGLPRVRFPVAHLRNLGSELLRAVLQTMVLAACLPHRGYVMIDAIVRTLYRMAISRRKLLEWETAAQTEQRSATSRFSILQRMALVPAMAAAIAVMLPRGSWPAAAPWLLPWALSPLIAHFISLPFMPKRKELSAGDRRWLRLLARDTWSYFETLVGPQTNWLPPDNLQEYPEEKLAERISPTNEGLYLVSALVARDFGYLGLHSLVELWEKNLAAWTQLPQDQGHFYNWYDTSSLTPLKPRYVSTVDSGNLAASLLVLHQGVEDLCRAPVFGGQVWDGLSDTLAAAIEACERLQPRGARIVSPPLDELTANLKAIDHAIRKPPESWEDRLDAFAALQTLRPEIAGKLDRLVTSHRHPTADVARKITSLLKWTDSIDQDRLRLVPWLDDFVAIQDHGWDSPEWQAAESLLESAQSLDQLIVLPEALPESLPANPAQDALARFYASLRFKASQGALAAAELKQRFEALGRTAQSLALEMDFAFLFNPQRKLFAVGYNLEDGQLDRAHYDMLCSEARVSSHLAIAKGDIPYKHWFQLGRQLTFTAGQPGLLSWGGTMFEFLMPLLFQRCYRHSLLRQACDTAVARQREYGRQRGIPWGVSESAFAALASNSDYHYQSFGVPGLGLKRGLSEDLVVSPYSTMLALAVEPTAAVANLRTLAQEGGLGTLGFYDAVDYTPLRVPPGRRSVPVRCYMAHHQAMSLAAIANTLLDLTIEKRFHAHPLIRATEMLLEESAPAAAPYVQPHADEIEHVQPVPAHEILMSRRLVGYETPAPRTQLLSNGTYSVMLTNTGGGYSRCGDLAVSRWRADPATDHGGQFIYIRELRTGRIWSATYQPTCAAPDSYEVTYSIDKAEYRRRDGDIETHLEIVVSPDTNVELRQLTLTNHGWRPCELEVTSYVEVVLTTPAADIAHPAFQKLFIETEYIAEETALLAKRRPRESHVAPVWALHVLACHGMSNEKVQYESSREKFLGRGGGVASPAAMSPKQRLSGTTGLVLDPVFSLRCSIYVGRQGSASLAFTTGVAESREQALVLADEFHEQRNVARAFELAWVFNQVQLQHLHLTATDAHRSQQLAASLLFPQATARGPDLSLRRNRQNQSGLWQFGISGDKPILLVKTSGAEQVDFIRELILAQQYWQHQGLEIDLVILNTHPGSYRDELQEQLQRAIQESAHQRFDVKKCLFLLRAAQMPQEDHWLLESAAHVVLDARSGWSMPHADPTKRRPPAGRRIDFQRLSAASDGRRRRSLETAESLEFWNGFGGFADGGREYHIRITSENRTPAPWSNVIANPRFGCLVTEAGGGYTWAGNSRQNKLTAWSNDPVLDPPGEELYLRDDESGAVWRPLSYPRQPSEEAWVHHGQGYTRFLRAIGELDVNVLVSISSDDPIKFVCVSLHNRGTKDRRLTATYFAELVLGENRERTRMQLISAVDPETDAILVRNSWQPSFPDQVFFLTALGPNTSHTGDRTEFLGRNGSREFPAALENGSLSGSTGAGLDPCAAVQSRLTLPPGEKREIIFLLGAGADAAESNRLLRQYSSANCVHKAIVQNMSRWNSVLTTIQVKTPNRALDLLVNRWLLYQVLSCRLWGRSAFYQSSGAFGFRDQLQDVMALVLARPGLAREHLLRAAAHQYETGDVQHWWHPPDGEGARTRFSDDFLWLPFVTAHYLRVTGDESVLDEIAPYLHSPPLEPDVQERYELPHVSSESGTLYDHCLRALAHGVQLGEHRLPLIGCGDWNDGFSQVGALGRGESVWVGWFLLVLLDRFLPVIQRRGDDAIAETYRQFAVELRQALERQAWDGEWYRRAFFDDGAPLGSHLNDECQIDSIAQSWAVLAHADPQRTDQAIASVFSRLVDPENRIVKLLAPPFDKTALEPGYIKGYLPGVRENGGQYTHAACWLVQALAAEGDGNRAIEIYDYINPILHAETPAQVELYRAEPYVVAADVYATPPHTGRGGWTWYTGSASWCYRVAIESILGFQIEGGQVRFRPCLPADWGQVELTYRLGHATWHFIVQTRAGDRNGSGKAGSGKSTAIELVDDGHVHHVHVWVAADGTVAYQDTDPSVPDPSQI